MPNGELTVEQLLGPKPKEKIPRLTIENLLGQKPQEEPSDLTVEGLLGPKPEQEKVSYGVGAYYGEPSLLKRIVGMPAKMIDDTIEYNQALKRGDTERAEQLRKPYQKWNEFIEKVDPYLETALALGLVAYGSWEGLKAIKGTYQLARLRKTVERLSPQELRNLKNEMAVSDRWPEFIERMTKPERLAYLKKGERVRIEERPIFQKLESIFRKVPKVTPVEAKATARVIRNLPEQITKAKIPETEKLKAELATTEGLIATTKKLIEKPVRVRPTPVDKTRAELEKIVAGVPEEEIPAVSAVRAEAEKGKVIVVPKQLKSLAKEAKKYKSADTFVKAYTSAALTGYPTTISNIQGEIQGQLSNVDRQQGIRNASEVIVKQYGNIKVFQKTRSGSTESITQIDKAIASLWQQVQKPKDIITKAKQAPRKQKQPTTVTSWVKQRGGITPTSLKEYGINIKEDRALLLQVGRKAGSGLDDLAKSAVEEAIIPPTDKPTDALVKAIRAKATVVGEEMPKKIPTERVPTETINVGDLTTGQKVLMEGEWHNVKEIPEKGQVILQNGKKYVLDPFDEIEVEYRAPDKLGITKAPIPTRIEKTVAGAQIVPKELRPQAEIPKKRPPKPTKPIEGYEGVGVFKKTPPPSRQTELLIEEAQINRVIEESKKAGVPLDKLYGGPVSTEDIMVTGGKIASILRKTFDKYAGLTDKARRTFTRLENKVAFSNADAAEIYKESPIAKIDRAEREKLHYHREYPQKKEYLPKTDAQKKAAGFEEDMNKFIAKTDEEKGILYEKFPDAFIKRLDVEITKEQDYIQRLKQKKAITRHQGMLDKLLSTREIVKQMGYIHRTYIPTEGTTEKILKLFQRRTLKEKLSRRPTGFVGRKIPTPEQAIEWAKKHGMALSVDPLVNSSRRLSLSMKKWAISDFLKQVRNDPGLIHPADTKENPAPKDWIEIQGFNWQKALGKNFKNPRFEPSFARAINEYLSGATRPGAALKAWRQLLFVTKTMVFYNPIRLGINDIEQSFMAGIYTPTLKEVTKKPWRLLPFGNAVEHIPKTIRTLVDKDDLYRRERELGLFSGPNFNQQNVVKIMQGFAKGLDATEPNLAKMWRKYMKPISVDLFKNIRKCAWTFDEFQRALGVETLMARGMPLEDAVDRVKMFLADYSRIPNKTARGLSDFFLVPRYRISMGRLWAHILRHPVKEKETLAIVLLTKLFLKSLGYITAGSWVYSEFYRLRKKRDDQKEDVVTLPGPMFELEKWMGRPLLRSLIINLNVPISALIATYQNRDWRGKNIFDENASDEVKRSEQFAFWLRTIIAPYGAYEYTIGEEEYEQPPEAKILYHLGVYKYTRREPLNRETLAIIKMKKAKRDYRSKVAFQSLTEKGKQKALEDYRRNIKYWTEYSKRKESWFIKGIELWAGELPTGRIPILSLK